MILLAQPLLRDIRQVDEYARQHLIEQIMTMQGRSHPNPVEFRRALNQCDLPALRRQWQHLLEPFQS